TTTAYSANVWHHACGVSIAANSRAVYIDGGSKGVDTTSGTPLGVDEMYIGTRPDGNNYVSGMVAHVALWNAALSDTEASVLAKGYSPLLVKPQNLVCYWPLLRNDNDIVGGYHMTAVNAPTWGSSHPPIIMPAPVFYSFPTAAAVGRTTKNTDPWSLGHNIGESFRIGM
ncbi:MAG: LamG-like jellyroll fold domain-containing protein, partial [Candidatus Thorarchaeota archaeon]